MGTHQHKGRVVIRTDASSLIGSGHVMRCLTLADELQSYGKEVVFVCRLLEGNACNYIKQRGYRVYPITSAIPLDLKAQPYDQEDIAVTIEAAVEHTQSTCDWLIVDHYNIDEQWEKEMRPYCSKRMAIDDLADRRHDVDILLDQNLSEHPQSRYKGLVSEQCRMLLGVEFLLLRPSFFEARRTLRKRSGYLERLLVFFGGSDPTDETTKALHSLALIPYKEIFVDVVIGQANPRRHQIEQHCQMMKNVTLHIQIENVAELIAKADFALGAGGVAMWERCYLGLPSAVTIVADNQAEAVHSARRLDAIWNLGWHDRVMSSDYANVLTKAADSAHALLNMGQSALAASGSKEGPFESRVARILMEQTW